MTKPWVVGGVVAGALCAGWVGLALAQDRGHKAEHEECCKPTVIVQSEPRYALTRSGDDLLVFDTHTGRVLETSTRLDTVREVDSVAGVITIRKLEERDQRGVIRQGR